MRTLKEKLSQSFEHLSALLNKSTEAEKKGIENTLERMKNITVAKEGSREIESARRKEADDLAEIRRNVESLLEMATADKKSVKKTEKDQKKQSRRYLEQLEQMSSSSEWSEEEKEAKSSCSVTEYLKGKKNTNERGRETEKEIKNKTKNEAKNETKNELKNGAKANEKGAVCVPLVKKKEMGSGNDGLAGGEKNGSSGDAVKKAAVYGSLASGVLLSQEMKGQNQSQEMKNSKTEKSKDTKNTADAKHALDGKEKDKIKEKKTADGKTGESKDAKDAKIKDGKAKEKETADGKEKSKMKSGKEKEKRKEEGSVQTDDKSHLALGNKFSDNSGKDKMKKEQKLPSDSTKIPAAVQVAPIIIGGKIRAQSTATEHDETAEEKQKTSGETTPFDSTSYTDASADGLLFSNPEVGRVEDKLEFIKKQGTIEDDARLYGMITSTIEKMKERKDFEAIKLSMQMDIARKYIKDFIDLRVAMQGTESASTKEDRRNKRKKMRSRFPAEQ
ncbi:hypothetical protein NEMIN01_1419 [Nematocida minor]|uniref:uncharacterized protein n=1 Tax=Nematocida minor TaxID=1912983 RepID=UPI00222062DE|nr:uncharacterized protein NEMIN01_1419 [Nematocida minor]KAI5191211.1 hypothetical protein NEMIN01_1419 [Nematocida minor]